MRINRRSFLLGSTALAAAAAIKKADAFYHGTSFDVFMVAGQSNALGRGDSVAHPTDDAVAGIFQFTQAGLIIPAAEPLDHSIPSVGKIGFAFAFARAYQARTGRRVLLVPVAIGGTGFADNTWNPGDTGYNAAVSQTNLAIASAPGNRLKVIIFAQGEDEALIGWTAAQYNAARDPMIAAMRSAVTGAVNAPFMCNGMVPGWIALASSTRQPVEDALVATPARIARSAYVNPNTAPTLISNTGGDDVHYDAPSQRLLGARYDAAFALIT